MVRLEDYKDITENKAIVPLPSAKRVYIPLSQHLGKMCNPLVKVGDSVVMGQKIGSAEAHVFAPIHASVSGKVVAIEEWPHPIIGSSKAIIIENDGLDRPQAIEHRPPDEIEQLNVEEIRNIIFEAGVVGMGGAGFPTYIKLSPPKTVDSLIINGAECEPYLSGDYRLMIEKASQIIKGIELAAKCIGVRNVYIAIEDNKPKAIEEFKIRNSKFKIVKLKSAYPQGAEKQLIKNVLNREVPRGKLPFDAGVVVHNIATCFAIYEAVYLNKPLYERVLTVSGSCVGQPQNLLVRVGTPVKELINFCGPLTENIAKIIIGGPMMGIAQASAEAPVIKSTTGILLFNEQDVAEAQEEYCIRCGACVRECPVGLMPCLINLASGKCMWKEAKDYGAIDCIECGICNYVCPANRKLIQSIKKAKAEFIK